MNLEDLTPVGGSLAGPVTPPGREYVARFIHTGGVYTHPDTIWAPRSLDVAPPGRPLPGHGLEHEPVDGAERLAERTAQGAGDYEATAGRIRSAVRPGSV